MMAKVKWRRIALERKAEIERLKRGLLPEPWEVARIYAFRDFTIMTDDGLMYMGNGDQAGLWANISVDIRTLAKKRQPRKEAIDRPKLAGREKP